MLCVRLPEELENKLEYMASVKEQTKSACIREMVEAYFDEDMEDYLLAVQAIKERDPDEELISSDEAKRKLGFLSDA